MEILPPASHRGVRTPAAPPHGGIASRLLGLSVASLLVATFPAGLHAAIVGGGGSRTTDCISVFDAPGANSPAPPKTPRRVDCIDGDPFCDTDGLRNGVCIFDLRVCINSTAVIPCVPELADSVAVEHAIDNGDRRFDPDFQALQQRVDLLGFPGNDFFDACTIPGTITVRLKGPRPSSKMGAARKRVRLRATGTAGGKTRKDRDRIKFICRPEGDRIYLPRDLYAGTFDRIAQQIFAPRCALSGCHDSESASASLILLPNAAYSQTVGVTPTNSTAAGDGLLRITPADPVASFLYRKVTFDLPAGYGPGMPLSGPALDGNLTELIRLWILGDPVLGPAPATGWVAGTDQ